jgi:hypothetical protein
VDSSVCLFSTPIYFWVNSFVKKRKKERERKAPIGHRLQGAHTGSHQIQPCTIAPLAPEPRATTTEHSKLVSLAKPSNPCGSVHGQHAFHPVAVLRLLCRRCSRPVAQHRLWPDSRRLQPHRTQIQLTVCPFSQASSNCPDRSLGFLSTCVTHDRSPQLHVPPALDHRFTVLRSYSLF